jgi:hypothetical protein
MSVEKVKADTNADRPGQGIHVVAKPMGPVCNLACEYCFYLKRRGRVKSPNVILDWQGSTAAGLQTRCTKSVQKRGCEQIPNLATP